MISHKFYEVVLEMGSLKVYFLWESPHVSVPITKNFYWHDKTCEKSIGPFESLADTMTDYAAVKRTQKALQRRQPVQELQRPTKPYAAFDDGYGTEANQDKAPPDFITRGKRR